MKHDDGILKVYTLTDTSPNGLMPRMVKSLHSQHFFEFRTVGYRRFYRASGVNAQVDLICRIWEDRTIANNMAVLLNGSYYRIVQIQHLFDEDNLRVTDLSLERMNDLESEGYTDGENISAK